MRNDLTCNLACEKTRDKSRNKTDRKTNDIIFYKIFDSIRNSLFITQLVHLNRSKDGDIIILQCFYYHIILRPRGKIFHNFISFFHM